jgi:hypothetical protein
VVSGCWPPWYVRPVADAGGLLPDREWTPFGPLPGKPPGGREWTPFGLPPEFCRRQGVPVLVLYGRLATADPNPAPLATLGELARRKP